MSVGLLNNLTSMFIENNLNKANSGLNSVLLQLSSNQRINSAADDPAGISVVNGMKAQIANLNQSAQNDQMTSSAYGVASGALGQVSNLLDTATTLATEASNGMLNPAQQAAANQQYQSILSEIQNIGTTTTYNGEPVFGSDSASISPQGQAMFQAATAGHLQGTDLNNASDALAAGSAVNASVSGVSGLEGYYDALTNATNAQKAVTQNQAQTTESALQSYNGADLASLTAARAQYEIQIQMGMKALQVSNQMQKSLMSLFA